MLAEIKLALYAATTGTLMYLNIPQAQMTILASLMALDIITGIWKSLQVGTTSSKAGIKGVCKKLIVLAIPFAVGHWVVGMGYEPGLIMGVMFSALITYEFLSVMSNIYTIQSGKVLPEYDVITRLIKWLYGLAGGAMDKALGEDKTSEIKKEEPK